jgi:hypothetical protein
VSDWQLIPGDPLLEWRMEGHARVIRDRGMVWWGYTPGRWHLVRVERWRKWQDFLLSMPEPPLWPLLFGLLLMLISVEPRLLGLLCLMLWDQWR